MNNTIGDGNVGNNNTGRVDKDRLVDDSDGDIGAIQGPDSGVDSSVAVIDTTDNVVCEDRGNGRIGNVLKC